MDAIQAKTMPQQALKNIHSSFYGESSRAVQRPIRNFKPTALETVSYSSMEDDKWDKVFQYNARTMLMCWDARDYKLIQEKRCQRKTFKEMEKEISEDNPKTAMIIDDLNQRHHSEFRYHCYTRARAFEMLDANDRFRASPHYKLFKNYAENALRVEPFFESYIEIKEKPKVDPDGVRRKYMALMSEELWKFHILSEDNDIFIDFIKTCEEIPEKSRFPEPEPTICQKIRRFFIKANVNEVEPREDLPFSKRFIRFFDRFSKESE